MRPFIIFLRQFNLQKRSSSTVLNALAVIEQLQSKTNMFCLDRTPFENIFQLPELLPIRLCLSKPVLTQLISELAKSIKTEIYEGSEEDYVVKDKRSFFNIGKE